MYRFLQLPAKDAILPFPLVAVLQKIRNLVTKLSALQVKMDDMMLHVTSPNILGHILNHGSSAPGADQGNPIHHILKPGVDMAAEQILHFAFPRRRRPLNGQTPPPIHNSE